MGEWPGVSLENFMNKIDHIISILSAERDGKPIQWQTLDGRWVDGVHSPSENPSHLFENPSRWRIKRELREFYAVDYGDNVGQPMPFKEDAEKRLINARTQESGSLGIIKLREVIE